MKIARFLLWFFKPLFWLVFPYKTYNKERIPTVSKEKPLIVCSNHISMIDPVYLLMTVKPYVYFMSKDELFRNRFSAWFLGKIMGAFPVRRGSGDTKAIDTAKEIVSSGRILGIYPEGTRSKDGTLLRAKSGAALIVSQTGADVLPVAVVTKNQKNKVFRPYKIIFGEPISAKELHLDNPESPDLRYASRMIMEKIGGLMQEHTEE